MSTQTWLRDVRRLLDDMGVKYRLEYGKRHARMYLSKNGRVGLLTLSLSPSDRQSLLAVRTTVRHELGLVSKTQGGQHA